MIITYANSDIKHVCNSETTPWNSGKDGKEKRASVIHHNIRCKDRGYKDVY
jgi:hypothetical protein